MNIIWKGSPNQDSNRKPIDRIVCHWFGIGTLESANSRFQNPTAQVSAHYGISGETVYQWVKDDNVSYHAGNYSMNQRSIGIEHDATTEHKASDMTYNTSASLIANLCRKHNILPDRQHIIKHSEVVATQCPGTLDMDRLVSWVQNLLESSYSPSISPSQSPSHSVSPSVSPSSSVSVSPSASPSEEFIVVENNWLLILLRFILGLFSRKR